MRVHHLNCGTMCPRGRRLVNGSGGLLARGRLVCHCLLLETGEGLGLVDSGFGLADVRGPERLGAMHLGMTGARLDPDETAVRQIERLGLSPSDVRHVVLTHLDFDHAGGISDFPAAAVHVHGREHRAAMARGSLLERSRYLPKQWAHEPRWALHEEAGERWYGFDSVKAVPGTSDEVLLVPLFGHTRGHSGVAVRSGEGWLLHAGDSYFHHAEIYPDSGECPAALRLYESLIEMDRGARLENQRRLSALVRGHHGEVRVFSAHDPFELDLTARAAPAP